MNRLAAILLCVLGLTGCSTTAPKPVAKVAADVPALMPPVQAVNRTAFFVSPKPSVQTFMISVEPSNSFALFRSSNLRGWSFVTNGDGSVTVPNAGRCENFLTVVTNMADLAWDTSPDPDVIGYRIYAGTNSGAYDRHFDVVTNRLSIPVFAGANYFSATCFSDDLSESGYSPEVVCFQKRHVTSITRQ